MWDLVYRSNRSTALAYAFTKCLNIGNREFFFNKMPFHRILMLNGDLTFLGTYCSILLWWAFNLAKKAVSVDHILGFFSFFFLRRPFRLGLISAFARIFMYDRLLLVEVTFSSGLTHTFAFFFIFLSMVLVHHCFRYPWATLHLSMLGATAFLFIFQTLSSLLQIRLMRLFFFESIVDSLEDLLFSLALGFLSRWECSLVSLESSMVLLRQQVSSLSG